MDSHIKLSALTQYHAIPLTHPKYAPPSLNQPLKIEMKHQQQVIAGPHQLPVQRRFATS